MQCGCHIKISPEPGLAIRQREHLDSKRRGKALDGCSQSRPRGRSEDGFGFGNSELLFEGSVENVNLEEDICKCGY